MCEDVDSAFANVDSESSTKAHNVHKDTNFDMIVPLKKGRPWPCGYALLR